MSFENVSWTHGLGVALAVALAPLINKLWKRVADYDNRRMIAEEERVARKRAEKAAKKAAKLEAEKPRYTSATVVGPPRIGFDRNKGAPEGTGEGDSHR